MVFSYNGLVFHHQPWLLSVVGHIGILAQVKADKDLIEASLMVRKLYFSLFFQTVIIGRT